MENRFFVYSLVSLLNVLSVLAHPSGPPESACQSMVPDHSVPAKTTTCPFKLSADKSCFTLGQRILLTLQDVTPDKGDFKGLFVQARLRAGAVNSYGTFDTNGDDDLKTINCFGESTNSIGHANNRDKKVKIFGWTAPQSNLETSIVFRYTVVEEYKEFWTGMELELPLCSQVRARSARSDDSSKSSESSDSDDSG